MNSIFDGYQPWFGPIPQRSSGALVADRTGRVTSYAVIAMADRGELFVEVGTPVYTGMIVGERNRNGDLEINITKEKKLGNMRSSTAEATVTLRPPRPFSLDQSIEFIAEDELVEVTPENIRLRKIEMDATRRLQERRRDQKVAESEDE
jgi:GTP-binding protein